jgi:hypothetical protein
MCEAHARRHRPPEPRSEAMTPLDHIGNCAIIAHIVDGKSTLVDAS